MSVIGTIVLWGSIIAFGIVVAVVALILVSRYTSLGWKALNGAERDAEIQYAFRVALNQINKAAPDVTVIDFNALAVAMNQYFRTHERPIRVTEMDVAVVHSELTMPKTFMETLNTFTPAQRVKPVTEKE